MENSTEIILELGKAIKETIQMVGIAVVISIILGLVIGLVLYITSHPLLCRNKIVNTFVGIMINIIRSIPFLILLVVLLPLTSKLVGTTIGSVAAAVPLTVTSIAFFARLSETAFSEIDKGIIEAALAMGASIRQIITGVLLVEALPGLVRASTVTLISIIGFSAMAGNVGGGGIGDLAIRFGYYRYETDIMIITVVLLVVIVQVIQIVGEKIAVRLSKK